MKIATPLALFVFVAASALSLPLRAQTSDPLRAALEDSRATGKGVTLYVHGQAIAAQVVSVDDRFVVARSRAQGTIVVRVDRLDAVAGFVSAERKP